MKVRGYHRSLATYNNPLTLNVLLRLHKCFIATLFKQERGFWEKVIAAAADCLQLLKVTFLFEFFFIFFFPFSLSYPFSWE